MKITYEQHCLIRADRQRNVGKLLELALDGQIQPSLKLVNNASAVEIDSMVALMPTELVDGARAYHFFYLHACLPTGDGYVRPSVEVIWISCKEWRGRNWHSVSEFGKNGQLQVEVICGDLVASARDLVSSLFSEPCFARFEWKRSAHDSLKYDLHAGEHILQSVWKSGNQWATRMGNSFKTLKVAQSNAESAASLHVRSRHAERLAGLAL